jgi:chaperone required for assembly of F1-ATPase
MSAVQQNGRNLPRRFYKLASIAAKAEGMGWLVLLDERVVKTPLRSELILPTEALAEAITAEWNAQNDNIDPSLMPLTKLANTALDGVCGRETEVVPDLLSFAGRDLICYRADHPEDLVKRQKAVWDPLLQWAREELGAPLVATSGIMPVEQPEESIAALRRFVERLGPFRLTALHSMTTLTGSAILPLAQVCGHVPIDACWNAAHIDEDFQIERWGEDAEARARRASRLSEMHSASKFFALSA